MFKWRKRFEQQNQTAHLHFDKRFEEIERKIENLHEYIRNLRRRLNVMETEENERKARDPQFVTGDKALYFKKYDENGEKSIHYWEPQVIELLKEKELGWYVISDYSEPFFAHHSELIPVKGKKNE